MTVSLGPSSMIRPSAMTTTRFETLLGEMHTHGDDDHGHAAFRQFAHHCQDFEAELRVQRGGWLVEQHQLRLQGEGTRDRDALLLAAEQRAGYCCALSSSPTRRRSFIATVSAS